MNTDGNKEYSVNWKNHMSHVRKAFDHLLNSNELTDVTLCCEGKKIGAHKMLLSACSGYFRDTFKEVPCQHPVIILYGVEYSILSDILRFIYNGEVSVDTAKLDSFLKIAQLLQISGLTDDPSDSKVEPSGVEHSDSTVSNLGIEETFVEPTTSTSKAVKRVRTKEVEGPQYKILKQDEDPVRQNDTVLISDVKCEPSELVTFEDPLEDPLQSDHSYDGRQLYGFATDQNAAEEDMKRTALVNPYVRFKSIANETMSGTKFREKVVTELINMDEAPPPTIQATHKLEDMGRKGRRRCSVCYEKLKADIGRIQATRKCPQTVLKCSLCAQHFCLDCFFEKHNAVTI